MDESSSVVGWGLRRPATGRQPSVRTAVAQLGVADAAPSMAADLVGAAERLHVEAVARRNAR